MVTITGNPLASRRASYEAIESQLQKNLAAVIINDTHLVDADGFYLKPKAKQQALPYPNPIKFE